MRRRPKALFVSGVVLTLVSCVGVLILLSVGVVVLRDDGGGLRLSTRGGRRGAPTIDLPEQRRTPSVRPSRTPGATPTTGRPSSGRGSSSGPATRRPTTGTGGTGSTTVGPAPTPTRSTAPPSRSPSPTPSPSPRCASPGSATVAAVADAYVDQSDPTANFGSRDPMLVSARDRSRNRRALVRFALPALPAHCKVTAATLTVKVKTASGHTILASRAASSWSESSVTWNSQPGRTGAAASATASSTSMSWAVLGQVQGMYAGGAYGFVLRDAAEGGTGQTQTNLTSREGRSPPTLLVRWG